MFRHARVVVARGAVDREHTRRLADADDAAAGEQEMHIAGERGLKADFFDVRLAAEDGVIQVRDRPARGDVVAEQPREFFRRPRRAVVAPGAERNQQFVLLIEGEIAVHHGRDADRRQFFHACAVLVLHVCRHFGVAVLQAGADIFGRVRPDAFFQTVLPVVRARCDGNIVFVDEHRFDAGGTEFDAESRPAALDALFDRCVHIQPSLVEFTSIIGANGEKINALTKNFLKIL